MAESECMTDRSFTAKSKGVTKSGGTTDSSRTTNLVYQYSNICPTRPSE
jgi:hypothetical protein